MKPKQDWRAETCGTCEFKQKDHPQCLRFPPKGEDFGICSWALVEVRTPACAEWHPKEE